MNAIESDQTVRKDLEVQSLFCMTPSSLTYSRGCLFAELGPRCAPAVSPSSCRALRGGFGFMVPCTLGRLVTGCVSLSGSLTSALRHV